MAHFLDRLERAAESDVTVLLRGESGTGKELAAKAMHHLSPRRDGPFRAINCATLTPELLASELFGHVKGAFTGAVADKAGLFQLADRGTLFLDELADLPLNLQGQLLRVLQERTFVPVGGTRPVTVDVRLLSATHKSLREEVLEGRFRRDLMYRVRVVPMFLPPLRERGLDDLAALTWHFIDQGNARHARTIERINPRAAEVLAAHPWPGNVRELDNAIQHAFVMGDGPVLHRRDLPPEFQPALGETPRDRDTPEDEKARIAEALTTHQGHREETARSLGMSRSTLWRKMKTYGLSA